MKDHVTRVDMVDLQPQTWSGADSLCEAKGQETDKTGNGNDETDQPDFLSPSSSLCSGRHTKTLKDKVRYPKSDDGTIDIPSTWWLDFIQLFPLLFFLLCHVSGFFSYKFAR